LVANKTKLVSINSKGKASGNSDSIVTALSDDGRFVAFQSYASDLVKNDANNSQDVFVRDLVENKTTLVSANATRTASGNLDSYNPVLSADGKFVAFVSGATDLVTTNDTNNELPDVFVRPNR
jgi:Tol biopolymer transport system component